MRRTKEGQAQTDKYVVRNIKGLCSPPPTPPSSSVNDGRLYSHFDHLLPLLLRRISPAAIHCAGIPHLINLNRAAKVQPPLLQENNVTLTTHIRTSAPLLAARGRAARPRRNRRSSTRPPTTSSSSSPTASSSTTPSPLALPSPSRAGRSAASKSSHGAKLTDPIPGDGEVVTGISTATGGKVYQVSPPDKGHSLPSPQALRKSRFLPAPPSL